MPPLGKAPPSLSLVALNLHRVLGPDLRSYIELARIAEDAGIDQITLSDHVVMAEHVANYPHSKDGRFPFPTDEPWLEPVTTLAAMAGATKRIRLGTAVLIAPLRPAVLLAKMLATLDVLSGGRVELGIGVGWQQVEFDAVGVPFSRRWARTDDLVRACRALWTDAPASFQSETVNFDRIHSSPRPIQQPIPIWYGAKMTPALAARIAELGHGWLPLGAGASDEWRNEIRTARTLLDSAFAAASRDPKSAGIRCGLRLYKDKNGGTDFPRSLESVPSLLDAGADSFSVALGPGVTDFASARLHLEALANAWHRRA